MNNEYDVAFIIKGSTFKTFDASFLQGRKYRVVFFWDQSVIMYNDDDIISRSNLMF